MGKAVLPVRRWTEEQVKEVEAKIASNLSGATDLLILGIAEKFYRVSGDKNANDWIARQLGGSGFEFDKKRRGGEFSARDKVVASLLGSGATIQEVADTLHLSLATVHAAKKTTGASSAGGSKPGAGRTTAPAATPSAPAETTESGPVTPVTAPTTSTSTAAPAVTPASAPTPATVSPSRQAPTTDPVMIGFSVIDQIGKGSPESALDGWAILFAKLLEVSGYDSDTLAAHAAKLAEAGRSIAKPAKAAKTPVSGVVHTSVTPASVAGRKAAKKAA